MTPSSTWRIAAATLLISWPLLSCGTPDENSRQTGEIEPTFQNRQENGSVYNYPKDSAADGYGLAYLSHQLAVNPCLHLNSSDEADTEMAMQVEAARNAWPEGTCDNKETSSALTEFLYTRHAALAKTNDPIAVENLIRDSDQLLDACRTSSCVMDVAKNELHKFSSVLEISIKHNDSHHPDFVGASLKKTPITNDILNKIPNLNALCEGASVDAGERMLGDVPVYVVSCFTGSAEYPTWILEKNSLQLLLGLERGSNLYVIGDSNTKDPPDLRNSVRISAGEHTVEIYRFTVSPPT